MPILPLILIILWLVFRGAGRQQIIQLFEDLEDSLGREDPGADGNSFVVSPSEGSFIATPNAPIAARNWAQDIADAVVGPAQPVQVGPTHALVVDAIPRGAWDEKGWNRTTLHGKQVYTGYYDVKRRGRPVQYAGRVVEEHNTFVAYVADPPREIKRHPKGPCFRLIKAPWFRVEWRRPARNPDDAILYVQKVLDEALNGRRR